MTGESKRVARVRTASSMASSTRRVALVNVMAPVWPLRRPLARAGSAPAGNHAHTALLEILKGLRQLLPGIHDEGPVGGDGLSDGTPAEHEDVQSGGSLVLDRSGRHRN